jgi:hypothetical protein
MLCKIWGFHGSYYEECRLLGYKNPVRTSQGTHYVSATESSQLMLCKIWGFHGSYYEQCRLLGYKNPVRTSQGTHYVSATESSQLMLCKIWGSHGGDYEECRLLGYKTQFVLHRRHITSPLQSPVGLCYVRFEVLTAVTMKNAVFWDVTPLVLVKTDVSEELSASIIRVTRIGKLGMLHSSCLDFYIIRVALWQCMLLSKTLGWYCWLRRCATVGWSRIRIPMR